MVALGEVDMSGYNFNPQITQEVNGLRGRKIDKVLQNGIVKVHLFLFVYSLSVVFELQ